MSFHYVTPCSKNFITENFVKTAFSLPCRFLVFIDPLTTNNEIYRDLLTLRILSSISANRKRLYKNYLLKQTFRGVLRKRCSENMQQIYRRTPLPKCDFNKVTKQFYWNHTLAWVFSCSPKLQMFWVKLVLSPEFSSFRFPNNARMVTR